MPSLKDIKTRIHSVSNTAKITNAMKLVSAAKFARASHAVTAARPYSVAFDGMVNRLLATTNVESSPYLRQGEEKRSLIVIISTDRGLCGGLNSGLFKRVSKFLDEKHHAGVSVDLACWGRRAITFGNSRREAVIDRREKVIEKPNYQQSIQLGEELIQQFTSETYDRIFLAFPEFESALTQTPRINQLLPLNADSNMEQGEHVADMIVEPSAEQLMEKLLNKRVLINLLQALFEAYASEHGARMTAMDAATRNAKEVNRKLKLQFNRARQAAITKELIEITSGAEAL